jgi:mono/diheme cytochrome c family protein
MNKFKKVLLVTIGVFGAVLAAGITFTVGWRPLIGVNARRVTDRQFERTPERLARGKYLTVGLLGCEICHSRRDWTTHGAPMIAGKELAGQVLDIADFPGTVVAPNLTPDPETGAGSWTDDQIARAIREGIKHDGRALFPLMPYQNYRNLSDEDLASVVVYLRSVPAVQNPLPRMVVKFPINYLIKSVPKPVMEPVPDPSPSDPVARGKYLAVLGCGCHTPTARLPWAGGEHLKGPWGEATSANLTPDSSGITYYDEAKFITVLRTGYVGARKLNSIMPFSEFQNLKDDDLKAMFAYLRTVDPIRHRVDNTLPPTYCKICKETHGAGDQN